MYRRLTLKTNPLRDARGPPQKGSNHQGGTSQCSPAHGIARDRQRPAAAPPHFNTPAMRSATTQREISMFARPIHCHLSL